MNLPDSSSCTGCGACYSICPTNAISLNDDCMGFIRPSIDHEKCISCKKCTALCHILNNTYTIKSHNGVFFAGALSNKEELSSVSSGGISYALARKYADSGNIVYGAAFTDRFKVRHIRVDNMSDLLRITKSKYLPSDTRGIFKQLNTDLISGKEVLFTGLPCQIAAVVSYFKNIPDNLTLCEIICHGIPSPRVFAQYIKETESYYKGNIKSIDFRNKNSGWKKNQISIQTERRQLTWPSSDHPFHSGYLRGLYSMDSCSKCRYATLERNSDIVLADFWKYKGAALSDYKNSGISLIYCPSEKGPKKIKDLNDSIIYEEVDADSAIASCYHLSHPPKAAGTKKKDTFKLLFNDYGFYISRYLCCKPQPLINIALLLFSVPLAGTLFENSYRKWLIFLHNSLFMKIRRSIIRYAKRLLKRDR